MFQIKETRRTVFSMGFFFFGNAWKPSGDYFGVADAIN